MPNLSEYKQRFKDIYFPFLQRSYKTKGEGRHNVALAAQAVRKERDMATREITLKWNEGHKALKAENDRLQAELKEWWSLDKDQIQNYGREQTYTSTLKGAALRSLQETVRRDVAKMRAESSAERLGKTKDITLKWKEGFAALKAENDQMQKDLKEAFDDELQMVYEALGDVAET